MMTDRVQKILLCQLSSLKDPGSRGLSIESTRGVQEIVLVRKGDAVFGYRNHCPHTGVNLEWIPNQFLDMTESFIQCATHGALFRIEDGYCLRGPCVGERLQKLHVEIEGGEVMLYTVSTG